MYLKKYKNTFSFPTTFQPWVVPLKSFLDGKGRPVFILHLAVIPNLWPSFLMIWEWFLMFLWSYHRKKNIVKVIDGSWLPVKNRVYPHEFVYKLRWTLFCTGAYDGFSLSCIASTMADNNLVMPGLQKSQHWPSYLGIFRFQHQDI